MVGFRGLGRGFRDFGFVVPAFVVLLRAVGWHLGEVPVLHPRGAWQGHGHGHGQEARTEARTEAEAWAGGESEARAR